MRILYVAPETPLRPAGGIATYLEYAIPAMRQAGHHVFLLTWGASDQPTREWAGLPRENVIELVTDELPVTNRFPHGPYLLALSYVLSERILQAVDDWEIDVIEACDFQSPALFAFARLQTRRKDLRPLCVTFNHGLTGDVYAAASLRMTGGALAETIAERQQMHSSDLVVCPSRHAADHISALGVNVPIEVVQEPYLFEHRRIPSEFNPSITHLGRVSIAKGVDRLVYFSNCVNEFLPVQHLLFVGSLVPEPFKHGDIKEYILGRLSHDLRERTAFTGSLPRDTARRLLPMGGLAPQFSLTETFSYVFLEALDQGLMPIVTRESAAAEFLPVEMQHLLLDKDLSDPAELQAVVGTLAGAIQDSVRALQEFNAHRLDPKAYAEKIGSLYGQKLTPHRKDVACAGASGISDVTVLMPVYKPDAGFLEAIDSLASQTAGPMRVIIGSDGNSEADRHMLDYAAMVLPEVEIVDLPRSGLLATRNALIRRCSTKWAVFLDADDMLAPSFAAEALQVANANECDAVIPMRRHFAESDEAVLRYNLGDFSHLNWNDLRMTSLLSVEALRDIGFPSTVRNGEADDWVFWLEFWARGYVARLLPTFSFHYRLQSGSMSWPWNDGQSIGTSKLLQDFLLAHVGNPTIMKVLPRAFGLARMMSE